MQVVVVPGGSTTVYTNDNVTVDITDDDDDGDTIFYTYDWLVDDSWFRVCIDRETGTTLSRPPILDVADVVKATVTPNDGLEDGVAFGGHCLGFQYGSCVDDTDDFGHWWWPDSDRGSIAMLSLCDR